MIRKVMIWGLIAVLCIGCAACANEGATDSTLPSGTVLPENGVDSSNLFTDRDYENSFEESQCIRIAFDGDSIHADADSVKISGTTATITKEATYILSGTLEDGMVIVDAPEAAKLQIVLENVSIHSETSAALYILEADKVFLTLAEGTENVLSNGGNFVAIDENNIDGALFSKQDLTVNGTGALTVTSPGGHGIVCKDDLVFTGGSCHITSASHGLDANDSIRIDGAALTIDAGKDGLHAENTEDTSLGFVYIADGSVAVEAEGDGISAGSYLQIENGNIQILAGGGYENGDQQSSGNWGDFGGGMPGGGGPGGMGGRPRSGSDTTSDTADDGSTSMKGVKAGDSILIQNGTFVIDSADDAIHANVSAIINGGTFDIASGDDAIHAEQNLTITDGSIQITQSYEGLEALHILVSGGDIRLKALDDGINAAGGTDSSGTGGRDQMFGGGPGGKGGSSNGSIEVSGGILYIHSSGDGMDANGTLTISGGHVTVVGPTQGDTATLDYDTSGIITGGTFIGTGASGMAQTFSDSEQGVIAVSVGSQSAGTQITLTDAEGNTVISYKPELDFAVVILSSPQMQKGASYTITVGSASGTFEAS